MSYKEIYPEIEKRFCVNNPKCWTGKFNTKCPFEDVCFKAIPEGLKDKERGEFWENEMVKRYEEIKGKF